MGASHEDHVDFRATLKGHRSMAHAPAFFGNESLLHKMALTHYILRVDLKYYQIMRSNCILYKIPTVWLHHKGNQMLKWPACCPDLSHFKHNKKENMIKKTPTSWAAEIMSRTRKKAIFIRNLFS